MVKTLTLTEEEARKVADSLNYRHLNGTAIAVVQDYRTKEVLMVASVNRESVTKTLTTGYAHFWSLSRSQLWLKGETSGNYQLLMDFLVDCDGDAILFMVEPKGPACHTMSRSCFYRRREDLLNPGSSKH